MGTYHFPVDLAWAGSGSPGLNMWSVRTTGDFPSTGELQGLSNIIKAFYEAIRNDLPQSYVASYAGVATTVGEDPQFDTSAAAWQVTGNDNTAGIMPPALQICMTLRTSSASRSGRGRKFLGPFSPSCVEPDGTPAAATLTLIRDAGAALVAASSGYANGAVGVYSETQSLIRDVTGTTVRDQFAVLRSRRD